MKCTVYRKRSDISTLDVDHKTLYTCRNRKAKLSEKDDGSKFLATRRCSLQPIMLYFDPNGGVAEYTERVANVARRIKEFPYTTYGDKHLFGWYDNDGTLVSDQDVASVRTQYLTAHWTDPTVVSLDANGGSCDIVTVNLYKDVTAYNLKGIKAVGPDSTPNFIGWFTAATGGTQIKDTTVYNGTYTKLYAHYVSDVWTTGFTVRVDSEHNKAGIYSATRKSSAKHVYVDWGDGFTDDYNGNISQQVHTYAVPGEYHVRISDNISAFALMANSALWYQVTSQNYYTVVSIDMMSTNITSMSTYAFCYLNALESAVLAPNVKSIPNYAYYYCGPNWHSVIVPEGVTSIGQYTFSNCRGLNDITLPSTLTTLNTYSFQYCFYNAPGNPLVIPNGVTSIPNYCFEYCWYLGDLQLPNSLQTIGQFSFRQCWYHQAGSNVMIPEGVTKIDNYAFYQCRYLSGISLPSTLTTIGTYVFYQCQYELREIIIPNSCSSIGNYAFAYCSALVNITIKSGSAPTVGAQTFGNNTTTFTGRNDYNKKTNMLHVPVGATGYTTTPWTNPLFHASYCGFTKVEDVVTFSQSPVVWVEFNPNGGNGGGMKQLRVGYGIGTIGIDAISPDGKVFDGWWTMKNGGMQITEETVYDGEWQVAYAHWKET